MARLSSSTEAVQASSSPERVAMAFTAAWALGNVAIGRAAIGITEQVDELAEQVRPVGHAAPRSDSR